MHAIDFRISTQIHHDVSGVDSLRFRAGFEDWDRPGAFVIQLEEARGYDVGREVMDWSPVARFEHLRPHDVFDPTEGLHLDVYRRSDPAGEYRTIQFGISPAWRDAKALFFSLQYVFEFERNVELLLEYYVGQRATITPAEIALPDGLVS